MTSCTKQAPPPASEALVLTTKAQAGALDAAETYSGEVRARFESNLSFRVAGKLLTRHVHLGDEVEKGTVLAQLDPSDALTQQTAAQAQLSAAQGRLSFARQTHDRSVLEARDDLLARAELQQSESALTVARAELEQAQAQVKRARDQVAYTTLVADRSGLISRPCKRPQARMNARFSA